MLDRYTNKFELNYNNASFNFNTYFRKALDKIISS